MVRSRLVVAAVCAASVAGIGANAALAGDITGKPGASKYIAGSDDAPLNGNSACAYSGLNDEYYIDGITTDPRTQTPNDGPFPGVAGYGCNPSPNGRQGPKA